MEKETYNEIELEINELNIKESLKKELLYFNKKLNEFIKNKNILKFDVLIDNMSKENIDILLEHTTNIIEKYNISTEFIKYRDNIKNLDEIKDSVIVIDEFNIFENRILDSWHSNEKLNQFYTKTKLNNNIIILTCTNKIEDHLKDIDNILFDPKLFIHLKENESTKNIYNKLISKYEENNINHKLSYNIFKKIIDSIDDNYYIKHFNIIDYIYDYSIKKIILNNNKIINKKTFEDIIEETEQKQSSNNKNITQINNLIGLNNIKNELETLYNYLEFNKKIKSNNNIYLNMFFLGNPGTGKTTIARIYSKKLYELGYIKSDKLMEIIPNDLMGSYVGQTKDTTRKIFENAKGGILFIDEAYQIDEDIKKNNMFMKEALIELLKYTEDPQNVVIFAGYKDKMKELYHDNPGIKSRIYKEIIFEDYKVNELYEILNQDLKEKGLKLDNKSKNKIIKYIEYLKQDINFGNARTIKQLSQKMIMNHANKKLLKDNLVIDSSDLPKKEINNQVRMGFGIYDWRKFIKK